jgi:K+-sensing histidine kinase KdpD
LFKNISDIDSAKAATDSLVVQLTNSIEQDASNFTLYKQLTYILAGVAFCLLVFFIIYLLKFSKSKKLLYNLQDNLEDNISKNCSVCEENKHLIDDLKSQIDAINQRTEVMSDMTNNLSADSVAIKKLTEEFDNLREKKNLTYNEIFEGVVDPANSIKSLVELLRSYDFNSNELQDITYNIVDISCRIVDNLEHIQQLSEISSNKLGLSLESVEMQHLIDMAINRVRLNATKNNISFSVNISPKMTQVQLDLNKMVVVLYHLLSNAVRFSEPNSTVSIAANIQRDVLNLEVTDNGIGMSEDTLSELFRTTPKTENSNESSVQSGIGLFTIKKYVELHKGRVMVSSKPGLGTKFVISIPLL